MSNLSLPYTIANAQAADGNKLGANFAAIETWAQDYVIESGNASLSPSGIISAFGGSTAPTGWLLCDGTAVSRTTYADLFAVLGTAYGTGDGSTTFNLPNLKTRVPVGRDATVGIMDTLGETGGSRDATLPAHTHTGPSHTHSTPAHQHTGTVDSGGSHSHTYEKRGTGTHFFTSGATYNVETDPSTTFATSTDGAHTHTFTTSSGGSGTTGADGTGATGSAGTTSTDANLQPFLVVNYIVKT